MFLQGSFARRWQGPREVYYSSSWSTQVLALLLLNIHELDKSLGLDVSQRKCLLQLSWAALHTYPLCHAKPQPSLRQASAKPQPSQAKPQPSHCQTTKAALHQGPSKPEQGLGFPWPDPAQCCRSCFLLYQFRESDSFVSVNVLSTSNNDAVWFMKFFSRDVWLTDSLDWDSVKLCKSKIKKSILKFMVVFCSF